MYKHGKGAAQQGDAGLEVDLHASQAWDDGYAAHGFELVDRNGGNALEIGWLERPTAGRVL